MRIPFPVLALAPLGLAATLIPAGPSASQAPGPPTLAWPAACTLGVDCEIERYVDHDPAPGAARDYTCGSRIQDGHDGIDIRLPDMAAERRGVAVLAAADGQVLYARDGVADVSVKTIGQKAVDGVGCGNAVNITHANGFHTVYCHMARGSVLVKPGERVKAGQPIGRIGLSGLTEYPHLHFSLVQNGKPLDPFAYGAAPGSCGGGRSLWARTPPYKTRVVINAGFADAGVDNDKIEAGGLHPPTTRSDVLAVYVRTLGLKNGDVEALTVRGPDGRFVVNGHTPPQTHDRQQTFATVAKPRPAAGWPAGDYRATYTVTGSDGRVVLTRDFAIRL
jgi:hypothetical protein